MKQTVNVLFLLIILWATGCQSSETEAYLENLAEENATLLEVIQKKNQELDQITAQLEQMEASGAVPVQTAATTPATALPSGAASAGKPAKTDSTQQARIVIASGYPTAPAQQVKLAEPVATTKPVQQSSKFAQPRNVEEYLNQISDPAIELATRKAWKKAVLQTFANNQVEVFAEKKGFVNRYTAATLLDLLVYFPHQVKVSKIVKDPQDKIIQLRLQMNREKI